MSWTHEERYPDDMVVADAGVIDLPYDTSTFTVRAWTLENNRTDIFVDFMVVISVRRRPER